jgi:Lon protease-like protein
MVDMPLFPLNTVLFPGAPLQLHIFEERYKRMIELCLKEQRQFGVVLIREGLEALGPLAEIYDVGTSARILHIQRVEQGRMNIVVLGEDRFRVLSVDRETKAYLTAVVEPYPINITYEEMATFQATRLHPQVKRFIQRLVDAGGVKMDTHQLPEDPAALAYMASSILQISPQQKQTLLMMEELHELIAHLRALYRRELAFLDITLTEHDVPMNGSFSQN